MEERDEEVKFSVPFASKCIVEKYQKAFSSSRQTKINDFLTLSKIRNCDRFLSFVLFIMNSKFMQCNILSDNLQSRILARKIFSNNLPFFDRDKLCFHGSRSDCGLRLQTFSVLFNLTDLLIDLFDPKITWQLSVTLTSLALDFILQALSSVQSSEDGRLGNSSVTRRCDDRLAPTDFAKVPSDPGGGTVFENSDKILTFVVMSRR